MRERFEESERMSSAQTLQIFGRAIAYLRPFPGRMVVKGLLTLASLAPFLILPWPFKVLIDHVIEGIPISEGLTNYPSFIAPIVALLDGSSRIEMLVWVTGIEALLVILIGAMGVSGRERDQTNASVASGYDTATQTENQANAGWSFAGGLLGLYDFRWTIRLTQSLNHHYRSRLFERIQSLPMTAFDDERIGDAVYRVMYDTPAITEIVYRVVLTPIVVPIAVVFTALIVRDAYPEQTRIFWTALAMLPLALLVTFPFSGLIRRRGARSRKAGATTTSTVEEGMTNILAVQSLGGETRERNRFDRDSRNSFGQYRGVVLAAIATFIAAAIPGTWLVGGTFVYLGDEVIAGRLTKGDFPVLLSYFFQLFSYSVDLGALWIRMQAGAVGLHRVFFLMELPGERESPGTSSLDRVSSGVRVRDVRFRYEDGTLALDGVSMEAPVGQVTALVGPAGAGKTTLAHLIPRFIHPQEGSVEIDGVDADRFTRDSVRSKVALVFQENVLFDGTIEENIRLGKLDATELEVRRAAQIAGADEFIRTLPDGYRTGLGRAGAKLSVGQKQRLSIARALVRDAPILILDEPTSALDPETERRLVEALREASRSRVVIVIAHRLSTVRAADQILFLDAGRIVERGSHAELMADPRGAYRRFVELQTRGVAG